MNGHIHPAPFDRVSNNTCNKVSKPVSTDKRCGVHERSIIIGVDAHKYSHTAAAVDAWGQTQGRLDFTNDSLTTCVSWLAGFGRREDVIVAVEDANSYGFQLVAALTEERFSIRSVPAVLTERDRQHSTSRDKSDFEDAKRVAKVILTKYEETLPVIGSIAEKGELNLATELNLLLNERRDVVKQQTALKNQLHNLLHRYYGDHYGDRFPKTFHPKALTFYLADLASDGSNTSRNQQSLTAESIVRRINRLTLLVGQAKDIEKQIARLGKTSPQVMALFEHIHGCGILTAAAIMAELVTVRRFPHKDKLAKYAGIAPTIKSSGSHHRLYTNPFGNRLLNKALHTIALSQIAIKGDERGKRYYQKKLSEGKTKLWALRCLKRQMVNRVFQTLKAAEGNAAGVIHAGAGASS